MTDREKVIKGLECCVRTIDDCECADNCPYETQCWEGTMYLDLMRDALALLKAQEPRVMTLEEVVAHYSLPPVFVDDFEAQVDYYEDIQPLYFEFPNDNEDSWVVHCADTHMLRGISMSGDTHTTRNGAAGHPARQTSRGKR